MLEITDKHRDIFSAYARERYINKTLYQHCYSTYPNWYNVMGHERVTDALKYAVNCAEKAGYTKHGSVQFYVDLMITFGSNFNEDCQYLFISKDIETIPEEMLRSMALYEATQSYFNQVIGENKIFLSNALSTLSEINTFDLKSKNNHDFIQEIIDTVFFIYPEKIKYIGKESYQEMAFQSVNNASKYGLTNYSQYAFFIFTQLFLGQYFDIDPLCKWIDLENYLNDLKSSQINIKDISNKLSLVLL